MIKKKNNNQILLNSLFNSKSFYGNSLINTKKEIYPYLYGKRHGFSIINLKYTLLNLKKIFHLIKYILKKNKKILIIGNSEDIFFLLNKHFQKKNKNIIFFNKEWLNGILTNSKIFSQLNKKKVDFVLVLNSSIKEKYLLTELKKYKYLLYIC